MKNQLRADCAYTSKETNDIMKSIIKANVIAWLIWTAMIVIVELAFGADLTKPGLALGAAVFLCLAIGMFYISEVARDIKKLKDDEAK